MSYQKLIIPLLVLSLVLIIPGCGGLGQLLTPTLPEGQEEGVLYLEPANLTIIPGQDFTIELKTASITNLKGYSVTLSYDPTLLSIQEVVEGPFLSASGKTFFYKTIDNNQGTVLIDCALLGPELSISDEGVLATLSFTCLKAGSISIEFSLAKTRDTLNKEIITTKRNSLIKSK
jgi:hypothetical protein